MNRLTDIEKPREHKGEASELFLTYVRTKQLFKARLRRCASDGFVHIPTKLIESDFFVYPDYNRKTELRRLIDAGKLEFTQEEINGRKTYMYRCLVPGPIDITLIKAPDESHYKPIHFEMRDTLKGVSLPTGAPSTDYFDTFLEHKETMISRFFTVDSFAGRVHTPVTNFHRTHRPNILLDGSGTVSFDVATMQPQILGFILEKKAGQNLFSDALNAGKDIYEAITLKAGLNTRDEGKKRFFEIIFAPANNDLVKMFGDAHWIRWINEFKKTPLPQNPKGHLKQYSNVAWALQTMEVKIMAEVWEALHRDRIRFLSVHDEIIVKEADRHPAEGIFRRVLDKHFKYYKLNTK